MSSEPCVVSFKIRQQEGVWPYSTNIRYTTATADDGTVTNTYGCSGSAGAGKNFISLFGNNGGVNSGADFVNTGYAFQLTADWQTVSFATEADGVSRDWYLYICNMNTTVEIKDIEIYPAVEVADVRKAVEPLTFAKALRDAFNWAESDELAGLKENIESVEGITSENGPQDLTDALEGLQDAVNDFVTANLDDYLATCAKGSKWIEVSTKGQKIKTIGDWTHFYLNDDGARAYDTDRMMHCNNNDQATRESMAYWLSMPDFGYGSALGNHGLIMTKELKAGSYIFAMKGNSHTQYAKNTPFTGADGYQSNDGWKQGKMVISIENSETGEILKDAAIEALPALWDEYEQAVVVADIPADGKYDFVVNFTQPTDDPYYGTGRNYGGSYYMSDPQILCKLQGYNAKELAYIEAVRAQITAGRTNYDQAIAYQADENYLWGKADLKACTDTMLVKIEAYEAYDDASIVATFEPETYEAGATNVNSQLEHEVYVEVARDMIAANRTFLAVNDTLTSLTTAIANAKEILNARVYDSATGKNAFQEVISGAEALNAQMKDTDYSEENAAAIKAKIEELNEAAETFKATVPASSLSILADIDFANPAVSGEEGIFTISGAVNYMTLPNYNTDEDDANSTNSYYYQGFWKNGEKVYPEMLRVGNGEATVAIPAEQQVSGTNILKLTFDYYFARLTKTYNTPGGTYSGFYLKDADDNKIAQLYYSPYWTATENDEENTFGLNLSSTYLPSIGKTGQDNDAIAAENNVTHFEVVLDYGTKKMYCITTTNNGTTQTSNQISFDGTPIATFAVASSHENAARRCWFDNLKIEQITAGEPSGILTLKADVKDNAVYTINGVRVASPTQKGIYIVNGKKTVIK